MAHSQLRRHVHELVAGYLEELGDTETNGLYEKVLNEVEPAILEATIEHTNGNQSRAARILGMTRSTLRKRLCRHGLKSG